MTAHHFPNGVGIGPFDIAELAARIATLDPGNGALLEQTLDRRILEEMQGATALADGIRGAVPTPLIADERRVLRGDGTWGNVPTGAGAARGFSAAVADVDTSTTSTIEVDMADMSITVNTGGVDARVFCWFNCDFENSKANREDHFLLICNGVEIVGSHRSIKVASANTVSLATTMGVCDISDGGIIKVVYHADTGTPYTITVHDRILMVMAIPLTEIT